MKKNLFKILSITTLLLACLISSNVFAVNQNNLVFANEVIEEINFEDVDGLWKDGVSSSENSTYAETNKIFIYETTDLVTFMNNVNNGNSYSGKQVYLEADIDLSGKYWTPIGISGDLTFQGIFNGNGHVIYNLNLSDKFTPYSYLGLFGYNKGTIQNLIVRNVKIEKKQLIANYDYVGSICALNEGNIRYIACENVQLKIDSLLNEDDLSIAGFVGENDYESSIFASYIQNVNVSTNAFVDYNFGDISNCYVATEGNDLDIKRQSTSGGSVTNSFCYSFNSDNYEKTYVSNNDINNIFDSGLWTYMSYQKDIYPYPVLKGVGNYCVNLRYTKNNSSNGSVQAYKAVFNENNSYIKEETNILQADTLVLPLSSSAILTILPNEKSSIEKYSITDNRNSSNKIEEIRTLEQQTSSDEVEIILQASGEQSLLSSGVQQNIDVHITFNKRAIKLNNDKFVIYDIYNNNNTITANPIDGETFGLTNDVKYEEILDILNKSFILSNTIIENEVHYVRLGNTFDVMSEITFVDDIYNPLDEIKIFDNTILYSNYINTAKPFGDITYIKNTNTDKSSVDYTIKIGEDFETDTKIPVLYTSQFVVKLNNDFTEVNTNNNGITEYQTTYLYATFSEQNNTAVATEPAIESVLDQVKNSIGHNFDGYLENGVTVASIDNTSSVVYKKENGLSKTNINQYASYIVDFYAMFYQIDYTYNLEIDFKKTSTSDELENLGLIIKNEKSNMPAYPFPNNIAKDSQFHVGDKIYIYYTKPNSYIQRDLEYSFNEYGNDNYFQLNYKDSYNDYPAISIQMINDYPEKSQSNKIIKHKLNITSSSSRMVTYTLKNDTQNGMLEFLDNWTSDSVSTYHATFTFSLATFSNNYYKIIEKNLSCVKSVSDSTVTINALYGYILVVNVVPTNCVSVGKSEYKYKYNGEPFTFPISSSGNNYYITLGDTSKVEVDEGTIVPIIFKTSAAKIDINVSIFKNGTKIDMSKENSDFLYSDMGIQRFEGGSIITNNYIYSQLWMYIRKDNTLQGSSLYNYNLVSCDGAVGEDRIDDFSFNIYPNNYPKDNDIHYVNIYFETKKVSVNFQVLQLNNSSGNSFKIQYYNQESELCDYSKTNITCNYDQFVNLEANQLVISKDFDYFINPQINSNSEFVGYYYNYEQSKQVISDTLNSSFYYFKEGNTSIYNVDIYLVFDLFKYEVEVVIEDWNGQVLSESYIDAYLSNQSHSDNEANNYAPINLGKKIKVVAGTEYYIHINNTSFVEIDDANYVNIVYPIKSVTDSDVEILENIDSYNSIVQIANRNVLWKVYIKGYNVTLNENYVDGKRETYEDFALFDLYYNGEVDAFPERAGYTFKGWYKEAECINFVGIDLTQEICVAYAEHELFAKWERNIFEVTFDANLGEFSHGIQKAYIAYGTTDYTSDIDGLLSTTDFAVYTRVGYDFLGYSTDPNATETKYIKYNGTNFELTDNWDITNNTTLYAVWKNKVYEVKFDIGEGSVDNIANLTLYAMYDTTNFFTEREATFSTKNFAVPTRVGFNFVGYSLSENSLVAEHITYNGSSFVVQKNWKISDDTGILYAVWEGIVYEVTFDNGITTTDALLGEVTTLGATTLYVTYGTTNFYLERECKNLVKDFAVFTNPYLTFLGYSISENGDTSYITYENSKFTVNRNWNIAQDTTLYAMYAKKEYKISYVVQDITDEQVFVSLKDSTSISSVSVNTQINISEIINNNSFDGYTVIDYTTNRTGNAVSLFGSNDNLEITLRYKRNKYIITFDGNGGNVYYQEQQITNLEYYYGLTYANLPTANKTGYAFTKWVRYEDNSEISTSSVVDIASDHTLVAVWTNNIYEITFNANNGESGEGLSVVYVIYDTQEYYEEITGITLTSNFNVPTRAGYKFLGYAVNTNAINPDYIEYSNGAFSILKNWDIARDTTLYAVWKGQEVVVSFETYGGNEIESVTLVVGSAYGTLLNAEKVGYLFEGWYLSQTDGVASGIQIFSNTTVTTPNDHTLYAKYKIEDFYIHFNSSELEKTYDGDYVGGELRIYKDKGLTTLLNDNYFSQTHLTYSYNITKGESVIKQNVLITENSIEISNIAKNVNQSGTYKIIVSNNLTSASTTFEITITKYEIDFSTMPYREYLTKTYDTTTSFASEVISIKFTNAIEIFKIKGVLDSAEVGQRQVKSYEVISTQYFDIANYEIINLNNVEIIKKHLIIDVDETLYYQTEEYALKRDYNLEEKYKLYFIIIVPKNTTVGKHNISNFDKSESSIYLLTDLHTVLNLNNFEFEYKGTITVIAGTIGDKELATILTFDDKTIIFDGQEHCIYVEDLNSEEYSYTVVYEIYQDQTLIGDKVKNAGKYKVNCIVTVENFEAKTISATLTILKREVLVTAKQNIFTKEYDGTLAVEQTLNGNVDVIDVESGTALNSTIVKDYIFDDLALTAVYDNKNVGENKLLIFAINSNNYVLSNEATDNYKGKITKKDIIFTLTKNLNKTYNRETIGVVAPNAFTYTLVDGDTLNESFIVGLINAGTYDLSDNSILVNNSITNTDKVLDNYKVSYAGIITISKSIIVLDYTQSYVTYNGEEQEIAYTTSGYSGCVNINSDEMTIHYYKNGAYIGNNTNDGEPINAGTYTARFIIHNNFVFLNGENKVQSIDKTFVIEQKNIDSLSILQQEKDYDGESFRKTFTSDSINSDNKVSVELCTNHIMTLTVDTNNANVGTYKLENIDREIVIKDAKGNDVTTNYTFNTYSGVIKINKVTYSLTNTLKQEYVYTYDKTAKTIPDNDPVFKEIYSLNNADTNYNITISFTNGINSVEECVNAGTYYATVTVTNNNFTFAEMKTTIVIKQRVLFTTGDFSKVYDATPYVINTIPVLDKNTSEELAILDNVSIVGKFINNYESKTLVSIVGHHKILLQLSGIDKANYTLDTYDISANITKRDITITVDATEVYTGTGAVVSCSKMVGDNLLTNHTLTGYVVFNTCVNVLDNQESYDLSTAGCTLDNFHISQNTIDLKNNYKIVFAGYLKVIPATITLDDITDIEDERIYNGNIHSVSEFVFSNPLTSNCIPLATDYEVSYQNQENQTVPPLEVGNYKVSVTFTSLNFTFVKNEQNISSFTFTEKVMKIEKRILTISVTNAQNCAGSSFIIELPNIVKINNLVQGENIEGTLTTEFSESGKFALTYFDGQESIRTYKTVDGEKVYTTHNYTIVLSSDLFDIKKVDINYTSEGVYNGQVHTLVVEGQYNSVEHPERFTNFKDAEGNFVSEIKNAGYYTFDYVDGSNITTLSYIVKKLQIYGEVSSTEKEYDGTSLFIGEIKVVYYENNNKLNSKQYLETLGTGEVIILSGKFMNQAGNAEKSSTGNASIIFVMETENDNFELINESVQGKIVAKNITLDFGNITTYYTGDNIVLRKEDVINANSLLVGEDTLPSAMKVTYNYVNVINGTYDLGLNAQTSGFDIRFTNKYNVSFAGSLTIKQAEVKIVGYTLDGANITQKDYSNTEVVADYTSYQVLNGAEKNPLVFDKTLFVQQGGEYKIASSAKDAGNYKLVVSLTEQFSTNYNIVSNGSFDFVINKKTISNIDIGTDNKFTHIYNQNVFDITNNIVCDDICTGDTLTLKLTSKSADVGVYSISDEIYGITNKIVLISENGVDKSVNYNFIATTYTGSIEITKADLKGITLENETYLFDKQPKTLKGYDYNGNGQLATVLQANYPDINTYTDPATFTIKINENPVDNISIINAGNYNIEITVEHHNYNTLVLQCILTIKQRYLFIEKDSNFDKVYDGKAIANSDILSQIKIKTIESDEQTSCILDTEKYFVSLKATYFENYENNNFTNPRIDATDKAYIKLEYVFGEGELASNYLIDTFIPTAKISPKDALLTLIGTAVVNYTGKNAEIDISNFTTTDLVSGDEIDSNGTVTFIDIVNANTYDILDKSFVINFVIKNGDKIKTKNYKLSFAGTVKVNPAEINIEYLTVNQTYSANSVEIRFNYFIAKGALVAGEYSIEYQITHRSFANQNIQTIDTLKTYSSTSMIREAGEYIVTFVVSGDKKDNYTIVNPEFTTLISKKTEQIDLSDGKYQFKKYFGEQDNLAFDYTTSLNEIIPVQLSRENPEANNQAGTYDLFLKDDYYHNNYQLQVINGEDKFVIEASTNVVTVMLSQSTLDTFTKVYDGQVIAPLINPSFNYTTYLDGEQVEIVVRFNKVVFDYSSSNAGRYKLLTGECDITTDNYSKVVIADAENIVFNITKLKIKILDKDTTDSVNPFDKIYDGNDDLSLDSNLIEVRKVSDNTVIEISDDLYPNIIAKYESKNVGTHNLLFDMINYEVEPITANIFKGDIEIRVENKTFEYGYKITASDLTYTVFDNNKLVNISNEEILNLLVLEIDCQASDKTTSGNLRVNTYSVISTSILDNYNYTVDGTNKVTINKYELTLKGNFDKVYDNTNIYDISKIEDIPFVYGDNFTVVSATYADKTEGEHLITFVVEGADKDNYTIKEVFGNIKTKQLLVNFNYIAKDTENNNIINTDKILDKADFVYYVNYTSTFTSVLGQNLPTPTHEGYTFDGWKYQDITITSITQVSNFVDVSLTEITLDAIWTRKTYTATVTANIENVANINFKDLTVNTKQYKYGEQFSVEDVEYIITDTNYKFNGYTVGNNTIESTIIITQNANISAMFIKISSTLSLFANGGVFNQTQKQNLTDSGFIVSANNTIAVKTIEAGTSVDISLYNSSKVGYDFKHWSSDGENAYLSVFIWKNDGENVELSALYSPKQFNLILNANGGYFESVDTNIYTIIEKDIEQRAIVISKKVVFNELVGETIYPIKTGYIFDYYIFEENKDKIADIALLKYDIYAKDITVVAVFKQTVFTLNIGDPAGKITYSISIDDELIASEKSMSIKAGENQKVYITAMADKGYATLNAWVVGDYETNWVATETTIAFENLKFLTGDVNIYTTHIASENTITVSSNNYSKGNVKIGDKTSENASIEVLAITGNSVVVELLNAEGYEYHSFEILLGQASVVVTNNIATLSNFYEDISIMFVFNERTNNIKVTILEEDKHKGDIVFEGALLTEKTYQVKTNTVLYFDVQTKYGYVLQSDGNVWQNSSTFSVGGATIAVVYKNQNKWQVSVRDFVSDGNINVVFDLQKFNLTYNYAILDNGILTVDENFEIKVFDEETEITDNKLPYNKNIKMQVTSFKEGYHLSMVSSSSEVLTNNFYYAENIVVAEDYVTFDAMGNIIITLVFEINIYDITIISNGFGQVYPEVLQVVHGQDIDLSLITTNPSEGYEFVSNNFVEVIDGEDVTLNNLIVKNNRTIKAIFTPKGIDLSVFASLRDADKYEGCIEESALFNTISITVDGDNVFATVNSKFQERDYILTKTQTGKTVTILVDLTGVKGYDVDSVYSGKITTKNSYYMSANIETIGNVRKITITDFVNNGDVVISFKAVVYDIQVSFVEKDSGMKVFKDSAQISLGDTQTLDDYYRYEDGIMTLGVKYNSKLSFNAYINFGYVLYDISENSSDNMYLSQGISCEQTAKEPVGKYTFTRQYDFTFNFDILETNSTSFIKIYVKNLVFKVTFNLNYNNYDTVNSPIYYGQIKYGGSEVEKISDEYAYDILQIQNPTSNSEAWVFAGWFIEGYGKTAYFVENGKIYYYLNGNRIDSFYGTGLEDDYLEKESYDITFCAYWTPNIFKIDVVYVPESAKNYNISMDDIFTANTGGKVSYENYVTVISTYDVEVKVPNAPDGYVYVGYKVVYAGTENIYDGKMGTETIFALKMPSADLEIRFIYSIRVSIESSNNGQISWDNINFFKEKQSQQFSNNVSPENFISVYAKADKGYEFLHFEINGVKISESNEVYDINVNGGLVVLKIKKLDNVLDVRSVFIGQKINIEFIKGQYHFVQSVNNVQLIYQNNSAKTNNFRIGETLSFEILGTHDGYKFNGFENYGFAYNFVITPEDIDGLVFKPTSTEKELKFQISVDGGNELVEFTNGYKTGEIWSLKYGKQLSFTFTFADRYKFGELITLNGYPINYNGNIFMIDTTSSNIILSETQTNKIVIKSQKLMWMDYAKTIYEYRINNNNAVLIGLGTEKNPYLINGIDDLAVMMYLINNYELSNSKHYASSYYKLKISLSIFERFWTPIGVKENLFNGTFEFSGYRVREIYYDKNLYPDVKYEGLFGICGENANFIIQKSDFTIIFILIGGFALLIITIVVVLISLQKLKIKRMEKQSNKSLVG